MSLKRKIACAVMAVTMIFAATGCGSSAVDTKTIGTYKENEVPVGIYLYGMTTAIENASMQIEDKEANVLETVIKDDVKGREWIKEQSQNFIYNFIAVEDMYNELGYILPSLSEEYVVNTLEQQKSYYPEIFENMKKNGISEKSYQLVLANSQKLDDLFVKYYSEGGVAPISEEEFKTQYALNYRRAVLLPISLKDRAGKPLEGEAKDKVVKLADEYLERLKNGESFDLIASEYMAFVNEKEMTEEEKEEIKKSEPKVKSSLVDVRNTNLPEGFKDAIDAAEEGEFIKLENEENILIAKKSDLFENLEDFEKMKSTLISELKTEEFNEILDKKAEEVKENFRFNDASVERYNVDDFYKRVAK